VKRTWKRIVFISLIMFLISSHTLPTIGGECVYSLFIPSLNSTMLIKIKRITKKLVGAEDL